MQAKFVDIIGIPFALGGSNPGPARGPMVLRDERIEERLQKLGHTTSFVDVREKTLLPEIFTATPILSSPICSENSVIDVSKISGAYVFRSLRLGHIPLVIGGDHSVSIGTLPQFLDPALSYGRHVGLLWIDAHYDAHTPKTSHSHYANGIPLATVLGRGSRSMGCYSRSDGGRKKRLKFAPWNVLHIGAGSTDCENEEIELLDTLGVSRISMDDIHRDGIMRCIATLERFIHSVDDIIVTIDLDAMHKKFAPGVSFPSSGGILPGMVTMIAERVAKSGKLRQLEIMEYNPDNEEWDEAGNPKTAMLACVLMETFLI